MDKIFPIQCRNCAENMDVTADIDVAAPYKCPMCGTDIAIAEAEDFDLPCPAAVVIEEHTAERLRFRLPRFLPRSDGHQLARIILMANAIFLIPIVGISLVFHSRPGIGWMIIPIAFLLLAFVITLKTLRSFMLLEFSSSRMVIRHFLGPLGFNFAYNVVPPRNVYLESTKSSLNTFFCSSDIVCVKTRRRTIRIDASPSPDLARYITHLIRRQFITMRHELQDG